MVNEMRWVYVYATSVEHIDKVIPRAIWPAIVKDPVPANAGHAPWIKVQVTLPMYLVASAIKYAADNALK
jgi:hypothetical protein